MNHAATHHRQAVAQSGPYLAAAARSGPRRVNDRAGRARGDGGPSSRRSVRMGWPQPSSRDRRGTVWPSPASQPTAGCIVRTGIGEQHSRVSRATEPRRSRRRMRAHERPLQALPVTAPPSAGEPVLPSFSTSPATTGIRSRATVRSPGRFSRAWNHDTAPRSTSSSANDVRR